MLSIIIPVYCVEHTLNRCVESVVGQSYADIEVILVDDGSPDDCPQMCDEWARRDPRVRVVHKANGGLSDARNAGLEVARGDYVTFVDSDDFLAPDTYRLLMDLLAAWPQTDLIEYPLFWHYGSAEQEVRSYGNHTYHDMKAYWLEGRAYEHSYACNKIYRRSVFQNVRFPVGQVFEDAATLPLVLRHVRQVMTTTLGLYYYCKNTLGITATAGGHELQMLLGHHLAVVPAVCDTRYYMHVVNIQLDVCRLSGIQPSLPFFPVKVMARGLTVRQRLKALALKIMGLNHFVKLNAMLR